jgi:hypothetical protein
MQKSQRIHIQFESNNVQQTVINFILSQFGVIHSSFLMNKSVGYIDTQHITFEQLYAIKFGWGRRT